jgi:hypothetical protein
MRCFFKRGGHKGGRRRFPREGIAKALAAPSKIAATQSSLIA